MILDRLHNGYFFTPNHFGYGHSTCLEKQLDGLLNTLAYDLCILIRAVLLQLHQRHVMLGSSTGEVRNKLVDLFFLGNSTLLKVPPNTNNDRAFVYASTYQIINELDLVDLGIELVIED